MTFGLLAALFVQRSTTGQVNETEEKAERDETFDSLATFGPIRSYRTITKEADRHETAKMQSCCRVLRFWTHQIFRNDFNKASKIFEVGEMG